LECPKALLVRWQMAFPIFNGGIRLMSSKFIALVTYLGSWALVAFVITSRFLLHSRPFLLEGIGANNLRPFLFQTHLKSMWEFFSLRVTRCALFWVIGQERHILPLGEYFKKIAWPFLYKHIFLFTFQFALNTIGSCVGLGASVWLLIHLVIHFFHLPSDVFSIALQTWLVFPISLGCPITLVANLWILWGYTFFVVRMVGKG
jgi:hypothetical protein